MVNLESRKIVLIKVLSAGTTMKNYSNMSHKKVNNCSFFIRKVVKILQWKQNVTHQVVCKEAQVLYI